MANRKSQIANRKSQIILGVDPGLADIGFAIIEKQGGLLKAIDYGRVKTSASSPTQVRLKEIHQNLNKLIKKHKPQIIGVEKLFFAKNSKTALKVGEARGVIMLLAGENKLTLKEFTPLQVKMALTGYGQASKNQIKQMVKAVLGLPGLPKSDDAADALAVAICCANSLTNES
ncbi:crossover junction endodeoxyribonuclease RuvC [Candidatus Falkowbacteria bacterium]|nr:crossover junction endodeoxyribonuclease RuvC [Candidatus Falkowbacteria bacterium]